MFKFKRLAAAAGFCDFDHVEKFYATLKGFFHEIIAEHEKEYDSETLPKVCFMLISFTLLGCLEVYFKFLLF